MSANHVAEAVRLNEKSKALIDNATSPRDGRNRSPLPQHVAHEAQVLAAQAQVHATLALVQATIG